MGRPLIFVRNGRKGTAGRREDLGGKFYRSRWEANLARYLIWLQNSGAIIKWEHEPDTFWFTPQPERKLAGIRRGTVCYTPDFKIWFTNKPDEPEYWELKGWLDPKSTTALKRMRQYYPLVRVCLIDSAGYKSIALRCRQVIANWET